MSAIRSNYVIAGYDLTKFKTSSYTDWKWTDAGEALWQYQTAGAIQIFDDPMDGIYLYLGYVLADSDEYNSKTEQICIEKIFEQEALVRDKLNELIEVGVIDSTARDALARNELAYKIIVFEEYT